MELAIAGSVLGLVLVELFNLRRVRKLRAAQEARRRVGPSVAKDSSTPNVNVSVHSPQGSDLSAGS